MYHYVYKITDPITNEYYIGSRSCNATPSEDDYMGSYIRWKPEDESRLVKEILSDKFDNRSDAILYEASLIRENIDNELNRNYHIPSERFATAGIPLTDKHRTLISKTFIEKSISVGENNGMWGKHHSESAKHLQRLKKLGKPLSEDHRNKIASINSGETHPMYGKFGSLHVAYGKKHSLESVERMKLKKSKPVSQIDVDGNILYKWDSATLAHIQTGVHLGSICLCCNGKRKKAGGYFWKWE